MNWGEINDWGQIVGYSETDALDPNGEDICGFGTRDLERDAPHKSAYQGREPCKRISTNFRAFAGQSSALPAVERP
jgi:hypothetical protein